MEFASYFIKNKALFGSFPTQTTVKELESEGVRYFINLTNTHEKKTTPYTTQYEQISFPISDCKVPDNVREFIKFIFMLEDIILHKLKNNELIYLHCKGGHGRSGVVVAVLLCHIFGLSPTQSLEYTTKYHAKRPTMREKWRKIGSPQTYQQKNFVYNLCKEIHFHRAYKNGYTAGFSNMSPYSVNIPNIGLFPSLEAAIQAYKCINDKEYVEKQLNADTPFTSKILGNKIKTPPNWEEIAPKISERLLKLKFSQHPNIKETLLNTGLSKITFHSKYDGFWGINDSGKGENILGKQLYKLRNSYYTKEP